MKTLGTKEQSSKVFYISASLVFLFVMWGVFSPSSLTIVANKALEWMITNFGWFYMLITAFFVLFVIILAISPFGKIRLGKRDEQPEYTWFSWVGMLFAAGIGVGFVFWGVAEPVLYYLDPPVGIEAETNAAATAGLRYGAYHWALHPWAIFSVVGLTLAYVQFNKGRPALISSAFYPFLGYKTNGWIGKTIDTLAVLATCTGVATTFGLSAMQITGGLSHLTPLPNNAIVQIVVIIIVTFLFMFSAARGVDRGIKILSNANVIVAGLLFLFVLFTGPTLFIAENFVTTLGGYITNVIPMSLTLTPFSESGWLGRNTIFFWAWHISWAPFMGLFIARISRGRTVREFVGGVLIVPALLAIVWFTTFGGTALNIELFGNSGLAELVTNEVELALFATLDNLPLGMFTSIIALILIFIFFITSADSATYVLGSMTSNGSLNPKMSVKLIWGLLIAGTASVLLLSGNGGLDALQTASVVAALPFSIIMVSMVVSIMTLFTRDFRKYKRIKKGEDFANVKEEVRDDFLTDDIYEDVKEHVYDDVKKEVYDDIKEEIYEEVKEQVYDDMKDNMYEDVKEELYEEVKEHVYDDMKDDVYEDVKDDLKKEIIDELDENKK